MDENRMTVQEALRLTVEDLRQIAVPAGLIETIGFPLARAIGNLNNVIMALENAEMAAENTEQVAP